MVKPAALKLLICSSTKTPLPGDSFEGYIFVIARIRISSSPVVTDSGTATIAGCYESPRLRADPLRCRSVPSTGRCTLRSRANRPFPTAVGIRPPLPLTSALFHPEQDPAFHEPIGRGNQILARMAAAHKSNA